VEFRYAPGGGTIYSEACDDGNAASGDGCEPNCMVTENPYPFQQELQYTGSWSYEDDQFGINLAADRDWLVVGSRPGGSTFGTPQKVSMATIVIFRHDTGILTGPKYVQVAEIRANTWTTSSAPDLSDISVSGNLIGWNDVRNTEQGQDKVGVMVLEWTGSVWQKKFHVPYPSSVEQCPILNTTCNSSWPSHAWLDRGRLIVSDISGDVKVPQGQPNAGDYPRTGRAFIFRVDGTAPVLEANLYDVSSTMFGSTARIFDDVAAIRSSKGTHLYRRTGTTWQLEQVLPCDDAFELDRNLFVTSSSCGISSSPVDAVNVFRHVKSGWVHEQTILPIDYKPDLDFGQSGKRRIAVSGNRIVIGARGYGVNDGVAYAYTHDPNRYPAWQGVRLLQGNPTLRNASDTITHVGDEVGYAVAVQGRAMIVGAPGSSGLWDKYRKLGKVHVYMDCPSNFGCALDVCTASSAACDGSIATSCDTDGLGYVAGGTDCQASDQVCSAGTCVAPVCDFAAARCSGGVPQRCSDSQLAWLPVETCFADQVCEDGTGFWPLGCHTPACTPNSSACVREVAGTCAADGSDLVPGGTNCRATGGACVDGACLAPIFYEGFEKGYDSAIWTAQSSGTTPPKGVAGGAADTGAALTCVSCDIVHNFPTRIQPNYIGFWARLAQVRFKAMTKDSGFDTFSVLVDYIDTHQSLTLENGNGDSSALGRWPSVRTTEWSLLEFKNIDWTARTFDFYYNGDLLKGGAPLGLGTGLDSIRFTFTNLIGDQRIDEIVVK
jgi:cysteine-rich repeat protein